MDLSTLTPPQRQAVEHTHGPCRVFAGPGSGKTHVLTTRLARLIEQGVSPSRILCCTFTKKAAEEMRKRVETVLGTKLRDQWIGTIHSQFYKILRYETHDATQSWGLAVMEGSEERILISRCIKAEGLTAIRTVFNDREIVSEIDRWRMRMIRPEEAEDDVMATTSPELVHLFEDTLYPGRLPENDAALQILARRQLAALYSAYQRAKSSEGKVDFTDMVYRTWDIFDRNPTIREKWASRFDFVLVDEMQDIDPCQWESVKYLARPKNNIFVVGDDDQSIYSFRNATPDIMLNFPSDFSGATTILLEQNFRCPSNIIETANRGIGNNVNRQAKKLFSLNSKFEPDLIDVPDHAEAPTIATYIQDLVEAGAKYSDIVVVYRINAQSAPFESEFMAREIPYEIKSGTCFFDKKEVADLVAYMELAMGRMIPELVQRIANKSSPARMISKRALGVWRANATLEGLANCWGGGLEPWELRNLRKLYDTLSSLQRVVSSRAMKTEELLNAILDETRFEDYCRREGEDLAADDDLAETLAALRVEVKRHPSIEEFLAHVARSRDYVRNKKRRKNAVLLSTFHGVKGLEWKHVILVGMNEELIPHKRAIAQGDIEEERRLAHVGLTRTKQSVLISVTGVPSRFVEEWFTGELASKLPSSARLGTTSRTGTSPS